MTKQERNAWAAAYRVYDEHAPDIRQAAALDDNGISAGKVFAEALEKITPVYDVSDAGGRLILLAAYAILEDVYRDAQKHAQERTETAPGGRATCRAG